MKTSKVNFSPIFSLVFYELEKGENRKQKIVLAFFKSPDFNRFLLNVELSSPGYGTVHFHLIGFN